MSTQEPRAAPDGPQLESPRSQAAQTPVAQHGDALSPSQALADSINAEGSQRVGSSPPVANPVTSFPERPAEEDRVERRDDGDTSC